jgi:regulator of extracellular matrix RemA (YlzA/DUF370 family)
MKPTTEAVRRGRRSLAAATAVVALAVAAAAPAKDVHLDMLKTRTDTYTDVTVYGRSKTDVFIRHSQGIANIKLAGLDPETIAQLNGEAPTRSTDESAAPTKPAAGQPPTAEAAASKAVTTAPALAFQWNAKLREQVTAGVAALKSLPAEQLSPAVVGVALGATLIAYLCLCYCFRLICLKTGHEPGLLLWLPVFQMIPLLRAAGMSGWWLLGLFVPVLNFILQIVWCFKIARARGKSAWTAVALLLPVTNVLALLYLAFSDGKKPEPPPFHKVALAAGPLPVEA